jgi:hypothetical protein
LTLEADLPDGVGCVECLLRYADGLRGLGQPVPNIVTANGETRYPAVCESTVQFCVQ